MERMCLVLPVRAGHSAGSRYFMQEFEQSRKDQYARSEERIGITKEVWFLAGPAGTDTMVGYREAEDVRRALSLFSQSREDFDSWFKRRLWQCTGVDLNDPPQTRQPELLSSYDAEEALV